MKIISINNFFEKFPELEKVNTSEYIRYFKYLDNVFRISKISTRYGNHYICIEFDSWVYGGIRIKLNEKIKKEKIIKKIKKLINNKIKIDKKYEEKEKLRKKVQACFKHNTNYNLKLKIENNKYYVELSGGSYHNINYINLDNDIQQYITELKTAKKEYTKNKKEQIKLQKLIDKIQN